MDKILMVAQFLCALLVGIPLVIVISKGAQYLSEGYPLVAGGVIFVVLVFTGIYLASQADWSKWG